MKKASSERRPMNQGVTVDEGGGYSVPPVHEASIDNLESISIMLHSLSNKLLPIVVCSELALKRCSEDQVRTQLEKIQRSANEVRDLITQMRQCSQREEERHGHACSD